MKLALIQMLSSRHWQANQAQAHDLLEQAAAGAAELAILPEYFCLLGEHDTDKLALAEPFGNGPIQHFLAERARTLGLWIVGGTVPLVGDAGHAYNSSLVFSPSGACVARYDKIHLFLLQGQHEQHDEARTLLAGQTPVLFELPSIDGHRWQIGLSICYDLRFPELYRHYSARGAELLLVPSAFTWHTGQAHWMPLLRARAIENLAFIAAAAQSGRHDNGRRTWGHSLIVDPWGVPLGELADGVGVLFGEIDAARLGECRAQLPAWQQRVLGSNLW